MFFKNTKKSPFHDSAARVLDELLRINIEYPIFLYNHCKNPTNNPLGDNERSRIIIQNLRAFSITPHGGDIPEDWREIIIEVYEASQPLATTPRLR